MQPDLQQLADMRQPSADGIGDQHQTCWPAGRGTMAGLVRGHDWAATPLGSIEHWPERLKVAVDICLGSALPAFVWWGARLVQIYNDAALAILHVKHPQALGCTAPEAWADVWPTVGSMLEQVIAMGEPVRGDDVPMRPDRGHGPKSAWFTFSYSALRDGDGRIAGLFISAVETTARVCADRDFRALFAASPTPLLVLAPDRPRFTVVEVNDAYLRATMRSRDALIGWALFDALPDNPDDASASGVANLRASLERVLASSRLDAMPVQKYDVARPDGVFEERYWRPVNTPVLGEAGRVSAIIHHVEDVTERHRAEQALRESEARYRLIVESAKDYAIVAVDPAGVVVSWNTGAERITGFAQREAIGQATAIFFTPEDRAAGIPCQELAKARAEGRAEHERWHLKKDGTRFWSLGLVVPLADDPALGFLKIFSDRTAERQAASARERHVAALRQADLRKDEFLATLAHELRNPLAPLRNVASLLKRSEPSPAQGQLLEIMERQIGQLRRLVEDLLEVSRITQGKIKLKREPMSVGSSVHAALEAVQPLIALRAQVLETRVSSRTVVQIDAARMTQVITNLLNNAAKFTPEGGRIVLDALDETDSVLIRVCDEGIGIAPEMLPRVFELFAQDMATTADQTQDGLGIGLSLVKRLVELHGGGVEAHSAGPGRGATFSVRLPRA